jgi:DNA-directed RNA polymerase sigma subunit (sigma70/sigma32)
MSKKQTIEKQIYQYSRAEWLALWTAARRAEMRRLRSSGWTLEKIGRQFGVSRQAVAQQLEKDN